MNPDLPRPPAPRSELVYEAVVDVGPRHDLGASPLGHRYLIDILGGRFDGPRLQGTVLPGGADRQLWRQDGVKQLEAIYEMRTHDGVVLSIVNRVLIDDPPGGSRYAFSQVQITAPGGIYDWLNKRLFVGTLRSLMPERNAVLVGVYQLV